MRIIIVIFIRSSIIIIFIMRIFIIIFIVSTSWTRGSQPWRPRWWAGWGFDSWWQFWSVLFYFDLISQFRKFKRKPVENVVDAVGVDRVGCCASCWVFVQKQKEKRKNQRQCVWVWVVAVYPSKGMEEVEVKERWTNPLLPSIAGGQQNTARQNLWVFRFQDHLHICHWVQRCQRAWTRAWRPAWACFVLGVLEIPRNCIELCVGFIGLPWKVMLWLTMKLTENEINGDTRRNCPHWNKWKLAETHFLFNIATLKL